MIVRLRPALILLAIATLVFCLRPSFGFYSRLGAAGAALALILTLLALFLGTNNSFLLRRENVDVRADPAALCLIGAVCLLSLFAIISTQLFYVDHPEYRVRLFGLVAVGNLLSLSFCAIRFRPLIYPEYEKSAPNSFSALGLVLVIALATRVIVLYESPDPVIDVYSWLRDAADHALHGRNPYSHDIRSPYGTERADRFGVLQPPELRPPAYPPLPFLLCLPFHALGCDVRWANILGDLVAGVALFGTAARRGRPSFGLLAACLFLNLPRSVWIIEQAWYEPMLASLFGLGFWLIEYEGRRRWLGFILLALGLTGKQFGLPLLFPLAWSQRRHWRMLLAGLLVAGLLMLPWLIWSPHDFFDVILFKHLHRPPQLHSLTFGSACQDFLHWTPPKELGWTIAALLILAISWRTPQQGAAAALGVGTALFVFCIFHTQGFPNYFYLCEYLWLLGAIGLLPSDVEHVSNASDN